MKKIVFLVLFLLSANIFAQKFTLQGEVKDLTTQAPVEYATVSIWNKDSILLTRTVTDAKGKFLLKDLSDRYLIIKVQFVGYETLVFKTTLAEVQKEISLPSLYLKISQIALDEIQVTGEKATVSLQIDKQVFSAKQFQNAANGTGLDLIQKMPSVTVNSEGEINMRGSTGFIVLINGKPSSRTSAEVLAQLPANSIEQIEIITTPSAKYDPDGKSGIINIITKQNIATGLSFSSNGMAGGIDPSRFGGDVLLDYGATKWSVYAGADFRRYDFDGFRTGVIRTIFQDTLTFMPSQGIRNYNDYQYSVRAGGGFVPDKQNAVNFGLYLSEKQTDRTANLFYDEFIQKGTDLNLFSNAFGSPNLEFFNQNLFVRSGKFRTANVDYSHLFANKSRLTLLYLYEYSVLGGPLNNFDTFESNSQIKLHERSEEVSPLTAWRLQTDFVLPLSEKSKVEIGYQYRDLHHKGDFVFERFNLQQRIFELDPEFTDRLDLRQRIHSGYVQWNGENKRFAYNLGLRAEYMNRKLIHDLGNQPFLYDIFNVFPSVQVLFKTSDYQKIRFGYTKRIDRPTTKLMSPFKNHRHSETIEVGDPTLQPEISDVAEIGFSQAWNSVQCNLTTYFNMTQNKIFRVNDIYSRTILLRNYTNAGQATAAGIEMNAEIKATSWWKFYVSGNLFRYQIKGEVYGLAINQRSVNFNSNANTTVNFGKQLVFQWDLTYVGKTVTSQGTDSELLLSNVGLRYTFLKKSGTLSLQLMNIFNSNIQTITTEAPNFYSSTAYRKYDRVLQIGFGYRFKDKKSKTKITKTDYGEKDF